jgi:hypothetical protein
MTLQLDTLTYAPGSELALLDNETLSFRLELYWEMRRAEVFSCKTVLIWASQHNSAPAECVPEVTP